MEGDTQPLADHDVMEDETQPLADFMEGETQPLAEFVEGDKESLEEGDKLSLTSITTSQPKKRVNIIIKLFSAQYYRNY